MEEIVIITQARINSTRFPKKILKKINNQTLLEIHINRIKKSKYGSNIIIATTHEKGSNQIIEIANKLNVISFKGSTEDVLDRFYKAVIEKKVRYIVRLTSDCPLIDPNLIDNVVDFAIKLDCDYVSNTLKQNYPDGQDIEVIKYEALKFTWKKAKLNSDREHVTPYIRRNSSYFGKKIFKSENYNSEKSFGHIRMTVDEAKDLSGIKVLIDELGTNNDWITYCNFIIENPHFFNNQNILRNEGYLNSLKND